ncbi:hypothetical protein RCL_jg15547.t1 [Rhizophagus clarus]|uniref:Uncharacterized protein n=1 Tax=Rhizophagus clarus TaxID=94130 RepID=A0A8H3KRS4_9GLOM|nr:hypothetical protein RCL_jg15547.t1 [Rhizophagus clarus]
MRIHFYADYVCIILIITSRPPAKGSSDNDYEICQICVDDEGEHEQWVEAISQFNINSNQVIINQGAIVDLISAAAVATEVQRLDIERTEQNRNHFTVVIINAQNRLIGLVLLHQKKNNLMRKRGINKIPAEGRIDYKRLDDNSYIKNFNYKLVPFETEVIKTGKFLKRAASSRGVLYIAPLQRSIITRDGFLNSDSKQNQIDPIENESDSDDSLQG